MLHRYLNIPNLPALQDKIFKIVPGILFSTPRMLFPADQNVFLNIPELVALIENLNLDITKTLFGLHTSRASNSIHVDFGPCEYSINIPIRNCSGTFIKYYQTTSEPTLKSPDLSYLDTPGTVEGSYYYEFPEDQCIEQDSFELISPVVMNVKTPHSIVKTSPDTLRITLLIRNTDNEAVASLLNSSV